MKTFISFLILFLIATCNAELRTWTAVNGKEVEAEFVSNEEGVVKLKLKSGKVFNVPLNKLSKEDQKFLNAKSSSGSLADNIVGKMMTFEFEGDEILVQFNGDGRMLTRLGHEGENGNVEDQGLTYKIEGNEVLVFIEEERDGGISFSSTIPKAGDQVEFGPEEGKMKGRITKIEKITKIEAENEILNNPLAEDKPAETVSVRASFKYKTEGDTVTITGCQKRASGELIIPSTIDGKSVTRIGREAFIGCRSLTSVIIPDSVSIIGWAAFVGCSSLKNITIPDKVTSIVDHAFAHCTSLTSIIIPQGITRIGQQTFNNCTSLTSINIHENVYTIGLHAFENCTSLKNVTIAKGVKSIRSYAFSGCTNLTSITIPDSIKEIGNDAFKGCTSLTSVTFLGDSPESHLVGPSSFDEAATIYRKPEAKGWGDTFGGRPVKLISAKP